MEYVVILPPIWLLFGVASAVVAANKGRSGCGWLIVGVLLGPFGLILALVVSQNVPAVENAAIASGGMKKCAFCAELIKPEAIKCRFCGSELPKEIDIAARLQGAREQILKETPSAAEPMSEDDLLALIHRYFQADDALKCRFFAQKLVSEHPNSLYASFATGRVAEIDKKFGLHRQ